ncbi:phage tail protein [Paraburkholderia terrae]|uniref:Phage tail protein n=1 Tax=Paraburkholderia terrae TaxID=311230 RepID=A0A2I8ETR3_9BURK|nr:phage tail protein [Paraburkholderia terrae]AUT62880.1 phage tail protein [Paraburkholderia terrae]
MITTFDEWLAAFRQLQPRAAGAIFDWCVSDASYELEPRVILAQFGDGYAQRRAAGINTQDRVWSVSIRSATPDVAQDVLAFLEARNGVDAFSWTPPRGGSTQTVICPSWSFSYGDQIADGSRLMNVSMKFQQVHQ